MLSHSIATTCPYCGVGCGVQITLSDNFALSGDCSHPANFGRLCSKGYALAETLELPGRLLYPQIGRQRASWQQAIQTVADRFRQILARYGPESIAFYVSGQLLTEDYYVANKLMKGFLGSANIDTNSRLCMASAVAAHKRAFGEDLVPTCYEDLELAETVVAVGSNLAWCHPVLFRRLQAKNAFLVVIDPRRTYTASSASLHLPLIPGSDAVLFNGLLVYLYEHNIVDWGFVEKHTQGLKEALAAAKATAPDIAKVASVCGLPQSAVQTFYQRFAASERIVSLYSQGINQSSSGTDKINALINCHLLTGRIGQPGSGPLSLTGQPNAMGGREVGGLANQLAAHMEIEDQAAREAVQRFWRAPAIAKHSGLKAVELFDAVADGRIRAVWIMATNPAVSLPEAAKVRQALADCEFVVVSDSVATTDTAKLADVLLPAAAWGEKNGTVTNSVRVISRQRPFRPIQGQARPDWWIICQVAKALGFAREFAYTSPAEIFREHAALSALNRGRYLFNLSAWANLSPSQYDALSPLPWPVTEENPRGTQRLFEDRRFSTPSRRAHFVPVCPRPPAQLPNPKFPFILNTGRARDQWHTMTRTGASPSLSGHDPEPFVEVNPHDALKLGLADKGLACLQGETGQKIIVKARISPRQRRGSVFVPMHWSGAFTTKGWVNDLIPAVLDPISGQPEFKHAPVALAPLACKWYGFLLSRSLFPIARLGLLYCTVWRVHHGVWCYEMAGSDTMPALQARLEKGEVIEYSDTLRQSYRGALVRDGRLHAYWCFAPSPALLPDRARLIELFALPSLNPQERNELMAFSEADDGHLACACFKVSEAQIRHALSSLSSMEELSQQLGAGSKCGSCLPELKELMAKIRVQLR